MKTKIFAVAMLVSGCGPFCGETTIGALVTFSETKDMCADYESRFVAAEAFIKAAGNPSIPDIDWSRWSLFIREEPTWKLNDGSGVAGMTDCEQYRAMFVGHNEGSKSALAHEMIHAMQGCVSGPGDEDGHKYWNEQGIWKLLSDYSAYQE